MWKIFFQQVRTKKEYFLISFVVTGLIIFGSYLGLFRFLEWKISDQFFRFRLSEKKEDRIVIVTIDEDDIQFAKQWPMSDAMMTKLLKNIKAQEPRLIALDLYRDIPVYEQNLELEEVSAQGHQALIKLFEATPNLVGVTKVSGNIIAPPPTLAEQEQVGANDLFLDGDGKIRRFPILLKNTDDNPIQGLGIKLALMYLEQENILLTPIDQEKNIYQAGKARFFNLSIADGEYQKEGLVGYQMMINYRGDLNLFYHISMQDVLNNKIPQGLMEDRVILIGSIAPSLNDNHQTPYSYNVAESLIPGVVIHANITSQVIRSAVEGRPMLRPLKKQWHWLTLIFWSGYSTTLGILYIQKRWLTWLGLGLAFLFIIIFAYIAFLLGWILPIFTPLFTLVTMAIISIVTTLWLQLKQSYEKLENQYEELQDTHKKLESLSLSYSRFVPLDYLEFLQKNSINEVKLGDYINKKMTIMFSDIRSFTSLAETMTPQENFQFINAYLKRIMPEIREQNGLVVKFMGDGVMAIFPQSADDAVKSGIAQLQTLRHYNQKRKDKGYPEIRIGLGFHLGQIMVGIIGEAFRMQNDILSDTVNLSSRLEGLTKYYGVSLLISETVYQALEKPENYDIRFLDKVIVKGKKKPIAIYEVFDGDEKITKQLKLKTQLEFKVGIYAYQQGQLDQAWEAFQKVLKINPDDETVKLYCDRIQTFKQDRLPPNWDGIWKFDKK